MKKKYIGLAFAATLALAACGGGKGPVKNAEFEEFSSQVSAVMYDIGLASTPPETVAPATKKNPSTQSVVATMSATSEDTYENNESRIWSLIDELSGVEECDVLSAYQDVFEQSFYIPLIMGDALRTYYKAENFYGVSAKSPWEQYVRTDKDGTKKTTFVYTPAGEIWDKETFIVMELDFRSQDDYAVQCKQFSMDYSSRMFAYLDSDGKFLQVSNEENNAQNSYITYCADGVFGYRSMQNSEVAIALLQSEFTQVNQDDVRSIQEKSKYSVDKKKWEEISAAYFDESGPVIVYYQWADEAQTILQGYTCHEPTEEIVVPARARYLLKDFFIDMDEGVAEPKRLVIPKTVVGVKYYDPNTPENMPAQFVDVAVTELDIRMEYYVPLQKIVVEEGSTIFESGEGHLKDKSGNVLTYVNAASPSSALDLTEFVQQRKIHVDRLEYYPAFCESIQKLVCKSDDFNEAFMELAIITETKAFPNLTDIDIACKDENVSYNWCFELNGNLKIQIDVPAPIKLDVPCQKDAALEVVLKNEHSKIALSTNCQQVTVRVPWSQKQYELNKLFNNDQSSVNGVDESKIVFAEETETLPVGVDVFVDLVEYRLVATLDGEKSADITLKSTYYGYTIKEVLMRVWGERNVFRLPSTLERIQFEGVDESNDFGAGVSVYFDGTKAQFESLQTTASIYRVRLVCEDYDGWQNKGVKKITFYNNLGDDYEQYVRLQADGTWRFSSNVLVVGIPDGPVGVYVDENGGEYFLERANETWFALVCPSEITSGTSDLTLRYRALKTTAFFKLICVTPNGDDVLYVNETMPFGTRVYINSEWIDDEYVLTVTIEFLPVGKEPAAPMEVIVRRYDATWECLGVEVYGNAFSFEEEGTYYIQVVEKTK